MGGFKDYDVLDCTPRNPDGSVRPYDPPTAMVRFVVYHRDYKNSKIMELRDWKNNLYATVTYDSKVTSLDIMKSRFMQLLRTLDLPENIEYLVSDGSGPMYVPLPAPEGLEVIEET